MMPQRLRAPIAAGMNEEASALASTEKKLDSNESSGDQTPLGSASNGNRACQGDAVAPEDGEESSPIRSISPNHILQRGDLSPINTHDPTTKIQSKSVVKNPESYLEIPSSVQPKNTHENQGGPAKYLCQQPGPSVPMKSSPLATSVVTPSTPVRFVQEDRRSAGVSVMHTLVPYQDVTDSGARWTTYKPKEVKISVPIV